MFFYLKVLCAKRAANLAVNKNETLYIFDLIVAPTQAYLPPYLMKRLESRLRKLNFKVNDR